MKKLNYFITGGTGSFSNSFIERIIKKKSFNKIIIYSRDEYKQDLMKNFPIIKKNINRFRFFIGDIRDKERLNFAIQEDIDIVIHAAALKQVHTIEYNPFEAIKTNIIGAQNIIEVCLSKNIKKVLALSTDKAAAPINLYGATKLTSDKLFISANFFKGKRKTIFSVVRYGNVMGSRGSVLPLFLKQKKMNNSFTLTHKEMTRFHITLNEAINFVENCLNTMKGGEIFVPKIPSFRVIDLIKALSFKPKVKIIGIRPGEKLHEEMVTFSDSFHTIEKKDKYIILPEISLNTAKNFKRFSYNSLQNKHFLSVKDIKKILVQNKLL